MHRQWVKLLCKYSSFPRSNRQHTQVPLFALHVAQIVKSEASQCTKIAWMAVVRMREDAHLLADLGAMERVLKALQLEHQHIWRPVYGEPL